MHQCSNHSAKLDIQDKEIQSNQVIHMVPLSCLWKNFPTQRHLLSVRVNIGMSSGSGSQLARTLVNRYFYHSFPPLLKKNLSWPLLAILIQKLRVWNIYKSRRSFWIKRSGVLQALWSCRWGFKPLAIFNFATSMHQFVLVYYLFPLLMGI